MEINSNFFKEVKQDLVINGWNNSKFFTALRMLFLDLGVQVLINYRLRLRLLKVPIIGSILARILGYFSQVVSGCDISSLALLEGGIRIPHANGIVIGRGVTVKSEASIYQQVTLGADKNENFPVVGSRVTIFTGAKVIGKITLGDDAVVGANSVVVSDVAACEVVAGVPARVLTIKSSSK